MSAVACNRDLEISDIDEAMRKLHEDVRLAATQLREAIANGQTADPARASTAAELFDKIATELHTNAAIALSPTLKSALRALETILPQAKGAA